MRGLLYGDFSQFLAQVLDCAVVACFGFVVAYVWFKLSDKITPIRVPADVEREGLDIPEVGAPAYPDFIDPPHALATAVADGLLGVRPRPSPSRSNARRGSTR